MYAAQQNEFLGVIAHHHVISPIGYGKVLKSVKRGAPVRSATEQHTIHSIAAQYSSPILRIPRVYECVSHRAYIMEHVAPGHFVPPCLYKNGEMFLEELNRFFKYMLQEGYFPYNFTILYHEDNTFSLLDFSQFGTVADGLVKFKHLVHPIHLFVAERHYGILSFLLSDSLLLGSAKIEAFDQDNCEKMLAYLSEI